MAHYLNKSSLPNNALYKTHENVKSFPVSRTDEQRRGRTDERRRTGNQKSSLEPSAQVSYKQNQLPLKIKGTTLMGNFEFKVCLDFSQLLQNIQTASMDVVLQKSYRNGIMKEDVLLLEQTQRCMYQLIDYCLVFYVASAVYQPHNTDTAKSTN